MTIDKCPECGNEFIKHGWTGGTLIGYSSPPGHNHDDNCLKRTYWCENDHRTSISLRRKCSNNECNWVGKMECFCHPDGKVSEWPSGMIAEWDEYA